MIEKGELGIVKISKAVIAGMAAHAALDIEGVSGVGGGILHRAWKYFRFKPPLGVKVDILSNRDVEVSIPIIIKYGNEIAGVSYKVQEGVKGVIEDLTGLEVVKVDVRVEGVE